MTFALLGLSPPLVRATAELGYDAPTPVQEAAIPTILLGCDVCVSAQTGSGKSAAFLLPLLEQLGTQTGRVHGNPRALIIAPTRELAAQLDQALHDYARHLTPATRSCLVVGGSLLEPQIEALREGVDVVIATPGRLLDLAQKNALDLSEVEICVLDEADRLLSLGFSQELKQVLLRLPSKRQQLLFSATFPPKVMNLVRETLRAPREINLDRGASPGAEQLQQRAIEVDESQRTRLLLQLLTDEGWQQTLVFTASRDGADTLATRLARAGVNARSLHGELSQQARYAVVRDFKAGEIAVVVATDLAARGLDIEQLSAVVNYDLPRSAADYVHRIGRTARAGEQGVAVSFITVDHAAHFRLIEKRHQLSVPRERIPGFEPRDVAQPVRDPNGGVKGKRKSKKDKLREAAAKR